MKIVFAALISLVIFSCTPLGYPVNVGREYGNPSFPFAVSHLPDRNQVILRKASTPHHNVFQRILCFRQSCRLKIGRQKALHPITFEKFKKKIAKNANKGMYNRPRTDSIPAKKPVIKKQPPLIVVKIDSLPRPEVASPILKSDSLIVLSEFLFETNSATLKGEHFSALDSIMDFLIDHPALVVKISGHTDNTGNENHNKTLSTKRAAVVAEYLIDNGVSVERVSVEGLGSSKPLMPNGTENGRRKKSVNEDDR